jgi:hypothetical protein
MTRSDRLSTAKVVGGGEAAKATKPVAETSRSGGETRRIQDPFAQSRSPKSDSERKQ